MKKLLILMLTLVLMGVFLVACDDDTPGNAGGGNTEQGGGNTEQGGGEDTGNGGATSDGGVSTTYTVTFLVDGENYATIATSGCEKLNMPKNPEKYAYIFEGWYLDKDVWEIPFTSNTLLDTPISSDLFIYAKFTYNTITGVSFKDVETSYDGTTKTIEVSNLPDGAVVTYDKSNTYINAGVYTITATVKQENHIDLQLVATLTINKATLTGIMFPDKTFTYDTNSHALEITGELPTCVKKVYANNDKVNAGRYTVTVSFEDTSGNYIVPEDMSAQLIIQKAPVSGIIFESETFTYNGEKHSLAIKGMLPEEVTVSYVNNGKISANTYNVTAIFSCETNNYIIPEDMTALLTIKKAVYDMSNVTFENKTVTYNGKTHSLVVSDNLPDGVTVSYSNNDKINANQYIVTAMFKGDSMNYYAIDDMQAILTINKATYDMSGISFVGGRFIYDGTPKSIYVIGNLPDGVTVNYTNNGKINSNIYTVTATFTGDTENYNKLPTWTASLIFDKATYDMSGISFKNQTLVYDTTEKNIFITGNLPIGVEVYYVGNGKTDAGTYTVTAKFNGDSNNYHSIDDMTATLEINQAIPYVKDVYCNQTLNAYSTVELIADSEVTGTITLDNGQTLTLGYKTYTWTFIPEDTRNYNRATGTVGLTVCALVSFYNDGVLLDSQNIVLNNSACVPAFTPSKSDDNGYRYTFSHWSIEENGAPYDFTRAIIEDSNLYAVYDNEEIVYTINYYNTKGVEHENITNYTVSTEFALLNLEKEHYVFNGWVDENGNEVTKINKGTFGTLNIYANWAPIEYKITYVLGYRGAINSDNPDTYNIEDSFSFANPTYDEYHTFKGWYLDKDFKIAKSAISLGECSEITLYAKWDFSGTYISTQEELNTLKFNANGVYELSNDIVVSNWEPIGTEAFPFCGYFNGNFFSITGGIPFNYNTGDILYLCCETIIVNYNDGVVSNCSGKVVKNLENGIITNSYTTSSVIVYTSDDSGQFAGGLVALNYGLIENCYVNCNLVNGYHPEELYIGLICGKSTGIIRNCYSAGSISKGYRSSWPDGSGKMFVGGIAGEAEVIENCYVFADLKADYEYNHHTTSSYTHVLCAGYVGGIAAQSKSINNCCFFGTVYSSVEGKIYLNKNNFSTYLRDFDATNETNYISCKFSGENNYSCLTLNKEVLQNASFVKNTLGWDENIWYLKDGQFPILCFELK